MSRLFYHTMQDNAGNLLFDVSGTMRIAGSGTLATIYGDEALTVILPNPMTNHPSFASFKCFLGAGDYDFYLAKSGYTFETLTGVQGHGTMAQQDASAVAITGGVIGGLTSLAVGAPAGTETLSTTGTFGVGGTARFYSRASINRAPLADVRLALTYDHNVDVGGLAITPTTDAGTLAAILFTNTAGGAVGTIRTTGSATSFNTSSDARLKHAITALAGALDVVQALRPVRFRWKSDDSPGVGFVAHEVQAVVDGVVTGERDGVDAEGNILPQQIDLSKLVPWLTAALQALSAQVAALVGVAQDAHEQTAALAGQVGVMQAQISGLEHQLGL